MLMTEVQKRLIGLRLKLTTFPGFRKSDESHRILQAGILLCRHLAGDKHEECQDLVYRALEDRSALGAKRGFE